jgi:hypothetical protein
MNQIHEQDAAGKTVKAIVRAAYGAQLLIVFDGGLFVAYDIDRGYESGDETVVPLNPGEFDPTQWSGGPAPLIEAGIVTQQEVDEIAAKQRAEQEKRIAASERQQYERLRQKFETPPPVQPSE